MKAINANQKILKDQKGVVVILVAFLLIFLLGVTALAIDIGYRHVVRNELQNAADAAALAAARDLGLIYEPMNYDDQQTYECSSEDQIRIKKVAKDVAYENYAGDVNELILFDKDIQLGRWDPILKFTETTSQPDAVTVIARRQTIDGVKYNGPVSTFFAQIFGIRSMGISAKATAALTPLSTIEEGGLPVPIGISEEWFNPENWAAEEKGFCDQPIKFYPTGDLTGCAGWNIYQEKKNDGAASTNDLVEIITKMNPWCEQGHEKYNTSYCDGYFNDFQSPETDGGTGETFTFSGGVKEAALPYFKALYDAKKDSDDNWEITLPIYESDSCQDNPSGPISIVGFASAVITGVDLTPVKEIRAEVRCELTEPGRGGGGNYGTKGSIPGLVE